MVTLKTMLTVKGWPEPFEHHDRNTLHRVAKAEPNPLARTLARRAKEKGSA